MRLPSPSTFLCLRNSVKMIKDLAVQGNKSFQAGRQVKESEEAPFLYPVVDGNGDETTDWTNFRALGHFSSGTLWVTRLFWIGYKAIHKSKPLLQFLWANKAIPQTFCVPIKTFSRNLLMVWKLGTQTKIRCFWSLLKTLFRLSIVQRRLADGQCLAKW